MATRNRIIYQSEALFTSQITGVDADGNIETTEVVPLQRITDISTTTEVSRENVNVFGKLSALSREIIEEPTVSMDFSYYLTDGFNESGIGLSTYKNSSDQTTNALSLALSNSPIANRNFYILTVKEGDDATGIDPQAAGNVGELGIISLGNAFVTNYSIEASVGEIPTASVSVEASNITFSLSDTQGFQNPGLNITGASSPQYTGLVKLPSYSTGLSEINVIRPGDIRLNFGTELEPLGGVILDGMTAPNKQAAHIQSFSLELPLSRTPIQKLGSAFAFSRELDVPIDITLSVTANAADLQTGSLRNLICEAPNTRDINIDMFDTCGTEGSERVMNFQLLGATLDSQNFSSSIGDNKTVELTFTAQVGGSNDTSNGLFISGKNF